MSRRLVTNDSDVEDAYETVQWALGNSLHTNSNRDTLTNHVVSATVSLKIII